MHGLDDTIAASNVTKSRRICGFIQILSSSVAEVPCDFIVVLQGPKAFMANGKMPRWQWEDDSPARTWCQASLSRGLEGALQALKLSRITLQKLCCVKQGHVYHVLEARVGRGTAVCWGSSGRVLAGAGHRAGVAPVGLGDFCSLLCTPSKCQ